ncbi:LysR substrate-binding domain-containing protein [Ramlibacter tataouinensis]|uniref:Transcriptional regulator, LysR family-like protein n=1 Tax=Ramlibacter tataouinensis (strain ATCC BAA-407 / DSM 14655 / LMG 21543 / TTB310) TaxID=365046 RepID=F5XY41_RAMTT|nr:LysR substrate-binding domain-containing protein [Ramlibacter tataouinensis]AEG94366.1 transcriptional regulator, LysR family-like protein [Ramlibacter tataouinensis TTB310]
MELRQLRYFTVLAAELSFTRAARKLHVSQPPLSLQIANLEKELGARLFERTSRSVQLSDAGKAFLPHALAVLERLDEARSHVGLVANGLEGRIKLGLSGSHFLGPLPRFIQRFGASRPGVEIVLQEMAPVDHLRALREGRVDLSVSRSSLSDGQLASQLLWRDPVVAALPRGHRLARRKTLRLAELRGEPFVALRRESSAFAQRLFDACLEAGFVPRTVQQVIELPALVHLVAAGLGVALVPASLARLRAGEVATCRLGAHMPAGDVYALRRIDEPQPAVREFMQALLAWAGAAQSREELR